MRQFQLATSAFSAGVLPSSGGWGKRASIQAVIAALSVSTHPSSVRSAGTVHSGFTWRKAALSCSPLRRSTGIVSCATPFSASRMRARRGLGAVAQS